MKQSIKTVLDTHRIVLGTRRELFNLFNMIARCHVTIGGSYALKYWCEAFADREVSDYDFILHATGDNLTKILTFLSRLNSRIDIMLPYYNRYDTPSYSFGMCAGKKVNIIVHNGDSRPDEAFEALEDIIKVKKKWCDDALKLGNKPRFKDVEDITTYEQWKAENDLPF